MNISKDVQQLLKKFPELRVDKNKQRVCCCLTGHEMPPREEAILSYVQGKKFLRAQKNREFDYDAYKPHLIPSNKKGHENKLFCMLTYRHITRQPADVEKHVKGKRYQRALQRWQKCQETGEVFRPRGPKRKRDDSMSDGPESKGFWESDSEADENVTDNMSDLYPSDDFASDVEDNGETQPAGEKEGSESDFDFEEMDAPTVNSKNGDAKPKSLKRKSKTGQKGTAKKKRAS
nr:hypothetical protein BaRGS_013964 [Batillaria attramentaria]